MLSWCLDYPYIEVNEVRNFNHFLSLLIRKLCFHYSKEILSCMFLSAEFTPAFPSHSIIMTLLFICAVIHAPNGPQETSQYEHSSIPATVKKLFNLHSNFLTKRDAWAGTFENYLKIRKTPRTDCPGTYLW
jgi:hypothetical protein